MDRRPPYEAYAGIMGTFAGGLAAAGALGRLLDRDPQCQDALDLGILAGVTRAVMIEAAPAAGY